MSHPSRAMKAAIAFACLLFCKLVAPAHSSPVDQATIEAAITLQLLSFTEWPDSSETDPYPTRTIGVFQSEEHLSAFQRLASDDRYTKRFKLIPINEEPSAEALAQFDAIFFPKAENTTIPRIVRKLENTPVVLIGTFDGFLEQGGMVKLIKSQKKLRFEIQLSNSKKRGIEYRAKLLRLAARIIKE